MNRRAVLPMGLMALSVLAFAAQGIVIKYSPKVGDKANYAITGTFEVSGAEVKLTGTRAEEVTKLEDDTVTTKGTTKISVNVMGQDMDQPESVETTKTKLDGTLVEVKQGEALAEGGALRLARVNTFLYPSKPLAVGDTWTMELKKDEKADLPGVKVDFKLEGEEKVGKWDTYKISGNGGESEGSQPTKIKATYWIDKASGGMIHSLSELTDAVFRPEVPPLSGKMDILRKD
ncbi:hypothetical protein EON82_16495 [bacterium]|nr:MAG: hypothetical protein EON82_16495 [bacterium]